MGRLLAFAFTLVMATVLVTGCIGTDEVLEPADVEDEASEEAYAPPERMPDIDVVEFSDLIPVETGDVEIHVRVVMPADVDEAPVIAEFTPYNAPGRAMLIEPMIDDPTHTYVTQFVERGFAFAFADVRGTSDSSGCMDLRGSIDIQDAYDLTEWLGTQEWSSGNVGFIGGSYPGSMAHIASIANNEHLGGVIPVVASTSFYDWHHKNGVPYSHHTTAFYYTTDPGPTVNPQYDNYVEKHVDYATDCNQFDRFEKSLNNAGTYDAWWADRDLNPRVDQVDVPVLIAHGLADWNVKPDHIDPYFNALETNKTLVAGQFPHSFPDDAEDAFGEWWPFAAAFFDWTLNGADTGLFDENLAYVEDSNGDWHVYEDAWPALDAPVKTVNITDTGLSFDAPSSGTVSWMAPFQGEEDATMGNTEVVLESPPLPKDVHLSGTPMIDLTVVTEEEHVHLIAVLEKGSGEDFERFNYGYLNPTYRNGLDAPERVVPGVPTPVSFDMFPQEDILHEGDVIRLTLSSTDSGGSVEDYDAGEITVLLDGERPGVIDLPLSPLSEA